MLLAIHKGPTLWVSGDGMLQCAPLLASGLLQAHPLMPGHGAITNFTYQLSLADRGRLFVEAWKRGDQGAAVNLAAPVT